MQVREDEEVEHAFARLRVLQLGETLVRLRGPGAVTVSTAPMHDYLSQRVHRHLSESEIKDSGFDAADLVLSLEGWIRTSPVEPNRDLIDRTFEVLRSGQETTAYWKPSRPFKSTQQGLVLLPQSVEIANSILRILGSPSLSSRDYFGTHQDLLEHYRAWLFRRVFRGVFLDKSERVGFVGWESEHTHRGDRIHLWQTSQALIFLQHYAGMLKQHIARKLLRLANLTPEEINASEGEDANKKREERWQRFVATDPVLAREGSPYRVYEDIDSAFVQPRLAAAKDAATTNDGQGPAFSMLLYGPPGTENQLSPSSSAPHSAIRCSLSLRVTSSRRAERRSRRGPKRFSQHWASKQGLSSCLTRSITCYSTGTAASTELKKTLQAAHARNAHKTQRP